MSLSDVIANLGDYTLDCILITKAEPQDWPNGPEIVWCNRAFTEMTGYELSEIIGKTPRLLQGDLTDKYVRAELGRKLKKWEASKVDLYNYTKSGTGFWVELSIFPVKDEKGWFRYWVSLQRDITERKNRELELQRANDRILEYQKYMESFSYSAFHDLRSPLRMVALLMESVLEDDAISTLSQDTQEKFGIIHTRINRMRSLVGDISRYVAAQKLDAELSSQITIHPWLTAIFDNINPEGKHKLHVKTEFFDVFVPKNEFYTIFANLFDNAIKHNRKNEINVFVDISYAEDHLLIACEDDGVGIPQSLRETVFAPFTKTKPEAHDEGSGFGLGFIRQIISRNGGGVHIEDSPYGGARFVIKWLLD